MGGQDRHQRSDNASSEGLPRGRRRALLVMGSLLVVILVGGLGRMLLERRAEMRVAAEAAAARAAMVEALAGELPALGEALSEAASALDRGDHAGARAPVGRVSARIKYYEEHGVGDAALESTLAKVEEFRFHLAAVARLQDAAAAVEQEDFDAAAALYAQISEELSGASARHAAVCAHYAQDIEGIRRSVAELVAKRAAAERRAAEAQRRAEREERRARAEAELRQREDRMLTGSLLYTCGRRPASPISEARAWLKESYPFSPDARVRSCTRATLINSISLCWTYTCDIDGNMVEFSSWEEGMRRNW